MSRVIPRSRSCLLLALLSLVAFGGEAARGQITFSPQEIVEGDIAFLDYRTDETVSHWTWDFGDGSSPESGPVDENDGIITQHQYGTLGDYVVTLTADDKRCSATLTVRRRGIPEFTGVKFGVSPRLAYLDQLTTTTLVTLSNASELEAPGRSDFLVKRLDWAILRADGAPAVSPSPTTTRPTLDVELDYGGMPLPPEGEPLDVTLTLYYDYKDSQGVRRTDGVASATQRGILTVAPYSGADGRTNLASAQKILSDGRFYKKGFPHELGWDDILEAYRAKGPAPRSDQYVYYHLLSGDAAGVGESARKGALGLFLGVVMDQESEESGSTSDQEETEAERGLAETVNEIVSGQLLIGNKRLIESLRVRYPRIADFDPNNPPERLPAPPEARQETAELEVALLDLSAGLRPAFRAIRLFSKVLRTFDPYGPFAEYGFPQYITFEDAVLAQQPIPMLNEYAQVSRCLQRRGLGGVELGKKLFNLSINDAEARGEAKRVLKETAHEVFVGACILAAAQGAEGYKVNDGAQLRAEIQNARDLFQKINLGLNPLGNRGEFIPNESFAAIYQDAQDSVADAREAEIEARQERRLLDQNQAALRNELQDQRASYITPLQQLTGVDPASYNNLKTKPDQDNYREEVISRQTRAMQAYVEAARDGIVTIEELQEFVNTMDVAGTGQMGSQLQNIVLAILNGMTAKTEMDNLLKQIETKRQTARMVFLMRSANAAALSALDVSRTLLSNVTMSVGTQIVAGVPPITPVCEFGGLDPSGAAILAAAAGGAGSMAQFMAEALISDVETEGEIRTMMLNIAKFNTQIAQSRILLAQEQNRLQTLVGQMDRLIEDLAHTRATASELYFMDPSYRLFMTQTQRRAEAKLEYAVDKLYRLAKTLEWEWTEKYRNPVTIPSACQEPASLENTLFDKFGFLEDVFGIRMADEAKDYLDALKAWDSKLRRYNVTSVRGPNHQGPFSVPAISMREQILGYRSTGPGAPYTVEESLLAFRDFLENSRSENPYRPGVPNVEFEFSTTIETARFFPILGGQWNARIHSIAIDVLTETGFSPNATCNAQLIQAGMVTVREFWARPPQEDSLREFHFSSGDRPERSIFNITVPCRINGLTGGLPPTEFESLGLKNRPLAATRWKLVFDTSDPHNRNLDFSRIVDIQIRFTYMYGNPPEFGGF